MPECLTGVFLNLFAGTFGVLAQAAHCIAAGEAQRQERKGEGNRGGFLEGAHGSLRLFVPIVTLCAVLCDPG